MLAYLEIVGAVLVMRYLLTDDDLRAIGQFTRQNIEQWLDGHTSVEWVGILPVQDFHAVCGDTDIPWATEQGKQEFQRLLRHPIAGPLLHPKP